MTYAKRIQIAAALSLMLHGVALTSWVWRNKDIRIGPVIQEEPIVLNLQPQELPEPKQLVDVRVPSEVPPEETDLIATATSEAMDDTLAEGDDPGPNFDEPDDFDSLAALESTPLVEALPEPPAEGPEPTPEPEEESEEILEEREEEPLKIDGPKPPPPERKVEEKPEALPDEFKVAQAAPPVPDNPLPRKEQGRSDRGVNKQGLTNFAAMEDELAPYLDEVRRRVERKWRETLLTRYMGTSPTKVELDCAIAADGTLAYVNIVGDPKDRAYAALCRDAMLRAGPFRPFPFRVPQMYRNKNLEIRWTFSFL